MFASIIESRISYRNPSPLSYLFPFYFLISYLFLFRFSYF